MDEVGVSIDPRSQSDKFAEVDLNSPRVVPVSDEQRFNLVSEVPIDTVLERTNFALSAWCIYTQIHQTTPDNSDRISSFKLKYLGEVSPLPFR